MKGGRGGPLRNTSRILIGRGTLRIKQRNAGFCPARTCRRSPSRGRRCAMNIFYYINMQDYVLFGIIVVLVCWNLIESGIHHRHHR